jgi:ABC-type branched-subunit amino acid transport system ATPase component/predicted MFS family arabinose efflux permease
MRNRLAAVTGGASATPLLILFVFNLVDEFDRVAFGVLTPEIRDSFGLSDSGIVAIASIAGVTALLAALPIGVLADRLRRVRLAGVGAGVWGGMTILTALSPVAWFLTLARMGAGIGRVVNEPVHASLLTDYYPPVTHPRVFALHRLANPIGLASALLIGVLGAMWDWRLVFLALSVPTFLMLPALLKLREPTRGESLDRELAEKAAAAKSVPFGEARRQLFAIRTLKRVWIAFPVLGIAVLTLSQLVSLFFERVYGYGPTGRGVVTFLSGLGIVLGLAVGQRLATGALQAGRPERLATYDGLAVAGIGVGLVAMVLSPFGWLSAVFNLVTGIAIGTYQPCYYTLVGVVSPARVRAQAYAWAILYLGGGALFAPMLADLGENQGYRAALAVLAATLVAGGLVVMTAASSVRRDAEQAAATLRTAAELDEQLRTSGDAALLTVRGLDVAYDGVQVLFGVDLEVKEGEIVALLGTNGAGKSTLLNAVSGLTDPVGGAVFYAGRDITHADAVQTAGLGIVQMPGGKASFPTLTVAEHFRLAGWLHTDDPQRLEAATEEVLERFPRLRERWETPAGALSGGEQQQLALGMSFIARPRLLLIDELSLGLSPVVVATLLDMVRAIHAQGTTVIVVEQSVNVALTLAERAYFLEKGQVRFSGPTADLLGRDDVLRSVFLAGAAGAAVPEQREPATAVDRDASTRPVLECNGLGVRFGGVAAVSDVDLAVRPGEVVGLVGANGAGKTTLFDLLSGYVEPSGGVVRLAGRDVTSWSPDRRAMAGLGRSFQDARIFGSLTVAENLAVSLERHLEVRSYLASGVFLPDARRGEDDVAYTVEDLVGLLGLGALRDKQVRELSTGSRRIVDLGMALAHDPSVLLLDEPSSGIAQRETEALGPLLLELRDDTGCALLVIEHDMPLLSSVCDRLVALELGRVIAQGPPDEVLTDERVVQSYLGGDPTAVHRSGSATAARRAPGRVRSKADAR